MNVEINETELDALYEDLAKYDLSPLWLLESDLMPTSPKPATRPWLWRGETVRRLAQRAGALVPIERGGDRRVMSLTNPGLGSAPFASSTLWGAVQYLGAHESAPGHRHTPGAIRFVLQGEGVWTTVNGDACEMRAGDLVLTPPWSWHDHSNPTDQPMIWFDGLDLPTVKALDAVFFEEFAPHEQQPVRGRNTSQQLIGAGSGLVQSGRPDAHDGSSPLLRYDGETTDHALSALVEHQGGTHVCLDYTNPLTGGPVLPTLACEMHRLLPGPPARPSRRVGNRIFVAFRGSGRTVIAGTAFDWHQGDIFVVPSWSLVQHEVDAPADLFAVTDLPIHRALGTFREEEVDDVQTVTDVFAPKELTG
ncbi:MAG: cupin domain-containing protein [Mycobacteriales bacterium]